MILQESFGLVIKEMRKTRGISQDTFAEQIGIGQKYLSDIELGKRNVSLSIIQKLANGLKMPVSSLLLAAEEYIK